MPFRCPECSTPKSLKIAHSLELSLDSRSDEITLQIVECSRCHFAGIAVYEESRRGALDDESFHHTGYHVDADDLRALKAMLVRCPDPRNHRCRCAAHRKYGRQDALGRWDGLSHIRHGRAFRLEL
jgi:hypothetical protein